jgi:VanZ family protein
LARIGCENMRIDSNHEAWRVWIPVLVWVGLIGLESSNSLSAANTASFLSWVLAIALPVDVFAKIDWVQISALNHALRTAGHLMGYGILSWLSFRAWRATLADNSSAHHILRCAALALALTAAVAGLDELHQSVLPSRSGKITDVALDSAAAVAVQFLILVQSNRREATPLP